MSEVVAVLIMVAVVVGLGVVVFTFASSGLSSLTGSFTGLMSNQGNAVAEHYAVEQVTFTTLPAVDGVANTGFTGAGPGTVTLSTLNYNDVIVVFAANENLAGTTRTVSTVTATGLTFHLQTSAAQTGTSPNSDSEVWYAVAASPLSAVTISVSLSGSTDEASIVAFGVSGANTASPWDPNVAIPQKTFSSAASAPTVSGVSTTDTPDLLLGFTGMFDSTTPAPPTETAGTGYGLVSTQSNSAGTGKSEAAVEDLAVSSTQSSVSIAFGTAAVAGNSWAMLGDAIQGQTGADVFVRNVGTLASTLVSVYVVDQTTGTFVGQFALTPSPGIALNAGTFTDIPRTTLAFSVLHGHAYSFTVTSSLGNSVIYDAEAS